MADSQKSFRSINSPYGKKICRKTVSKKTSVEELAEKGYTMGRVLGEGSYSKVKAAMFQGREIAVKILTRNLLTINFQTKFLPRELDVLSKVNHPNIVHVYKIYIYPKRIYIFMEMIQRGNMLNRIWENGRLEEFEAHKYFKQIVSAILYLHSMNIAHRDLKCENIMINNNDKIKIIDFGFSRSTVNEHDRRELSRTFCGSTAYASPEVLQGIPYNPMMSDVWSLGCVLYIMVTGTFPFDFSNVQNMVKYQLRRQMKNYPMNLTVSKPIKELISHMLEPDVTRRANTNQVSQSSWLKQPMRKSRCKTSVAGDGFTDIYSTNSSSRGTQTVPKYNYCRIHSWSECNCKK